MEVPEKPAVVMVVNLAGTPLFGPAALPRLTTVRQLKDKLPTQGVGLCQLVLGSEVLAEEAVLRSGDLQNPLVITSVVVPSLLRLLSPQCLRTLQQQGYLITPPPCFRGFTECIYLVAQTRHEDGPGGPGFTVMVDNSDLLLLADGRFLARRSSRIRDHVEYQLSEGTFEVLPEEGQSLRLQMLRAARHRPQDGKWLPFEHLGQADSVLPWHQAYRLPDQMYRLDLLKLGSFEVGEGPAPPTLLEGDLEVLQLNLDNVPFWKCGPNWGQAISDLVGVEDEADTGLGTKLRL